MTTTQANKQRPDRYTYGLLVVICGSASLLWGLGKALGW